MTVLKLTLSSLAVNRLYDGLTCLSKLGEYVSLDARRTKLTFSAFNSTMSAYGSMDLLGSKFFDNYQFVPAHQPGLRVSAEEAKFSCKFLTRALLPVFRSRSMDWKEKDTGIEKCEMNLQDRPNKSQCRLIIKLHCKHGVIKTYRLQYEELEAMHATFDRRNPSNVRNSWRINSRLLKEYIDHFGPKAENLGMQAEGGRVTFCSFTEKVVDGKEVLKHPVQTSVELDTVEFEEFQVEEKVLVAINVKDFRAIIVHAETLNVGLQLYYGDPGQPLQVTYDKDGVACEFVLMTRRKDSSGLITGAKVAVNAGSGGGAGTVPSTVPSTQQSVAAQMQVSGSNTGISISSSRMGSFSAPSFAGAVTPRTQGGGDAGGGDMLPPPLPGTAVTATRSRGSASPVKNALSMLGGSTRESASDWRRGERVPSPPIRQSQSLFLMDDDDLFSHGNDKKDDSEEEEPDEDVIGWDTSMTYDSFNAVRGGAKAQVQGQREGGDTEAVPPTQQERVRGLFD